jgi:hypothetical protein
MSESHSRGNAALRRLVRIAQGDTEQARCVANFLLAWWNAADCGGFDFTDLWTLDTSTAEDIVAVIDLIAHWHEYPADIGMRAEFDRLAGRWRPQLFEEGP